MATTDRHGFLLWAAGFTQSDIILNDLLLKLETKLGLSVLDRDLNQPAGGESDGDCYIVGSSPTGSWSAFSQYDVVILRDSTWYAVTPISGWPAWVEDENVGVMFNGTSWVIVSKDLPVDKLDATADPTVDNDVDENYSVGSHWYNVTDDKAFVCLDATDGAAVWKETTIEQAAGLVNKFDATVDPDADNDIDEGYTVGSRWVNTSSGSVFTCVDNTDGAAVWVSGSGLNQSQVDARVVAVASGDERHQWYAESMGVFGGSVKSTCFGGRLTCIELGPSSFEQAKIPFKFPKKWDGGQVRFRAIYVPSTTNTGDAEYVFLADSLSSGENLAFETTASSAINETQSGVVDRLRIGAWSSLIQPGGSPDDDHYTLIRMQRQGDAGTDTFTGDMDVIAIEMEYTTTAPTDD